MWIPQVAALAIPFLGPALMIVAAATAVRAIRTKRAWTGLAAVLVVGAATAAWLRTPTPPTAPAGRPGLRVMTLNTGASESETAYRAAAFAEQHRPDVVLFQEADLRALIVDGRPFRLHNPAIGGIRRIGDYRVAGEVDTVLADHPAPGPANRQVVLSRVPVVAHAAAALGPLDTDPGVYARVEIEWAGRRVALYNIHFRPFNPSAGWSVARALSPSVWAETPRRLRSFFAVQAEEAERFAAVLDAEPLPYIVAGDFNATPDQWARALLARRAREVFGRRLWTATRPDPLPVVAIDGILVSPEWRVREATVGPAGLSDHRALAAELVLGP